MGLLAQMTCPVSLEASCKLLGEIVEASFPLSFSSSILKESKSILSFPVKGFSQIKQLIALPPFILSISVFGLGLRLCLGFSFSSSFSSFSIGF